MNKSEIDRIIKSIDNISSEKKYWFVRTNGGHHYDEYIAKSFIAIGYNEITSFDINKAKSKDESGKSILSEIITKAYPDEHRPNYIAKQLIDFTFNIKRGDIVIIPSPKSSFIAIGEVVETPLFLVEEIIGQETKICSYIKRKKINWLKVSIDFDKIDSNLIFLKYSHRTVTTIDEYKTTLIDRLVQPIFIKNDDAHLSLQIRSEDPIKAAELFQTWLQLFELTEEFGKHEGLQIDKFDFDTRINVQSPGTIEFISYSVSGIVILSAIVASIIGAKIDPSSGRFKFKANQTGLIKSLTNYLNNDIDSKVRQQLNDNVKRMDIPNDDIVKLLEKLNS